MYLERLTYDTIHGGHARPQNRNVRHLFCQAVAFINSNKMAARLNVEEVVEMIFEGETPQDGSQSDSTEAEDEPECLQDRNTEALRFLSTTRVFAAKIFREESLLWLKGIHRRLSGRRRIRNPYYGEITRDMPSEIFAVLVRLVKVLRFCRPFCYCESNSKGTVISFTDMGHITRFLALLAGISEADVEAEFLKKELKGRRIGSKVAVLVREDKDFALTHSLRKGQLTLSFNFGEWNAHGFPQHN